MWAPGRIPAGTECNALASTIDLLPTIAAITGTPLPADRPIDGLDITGLLTGEAETVRNEFLYYTKGGRIEGIREGDWKLLVPIPEKSTGLAPAPPSGPMLFDLAKDPGERKHLAAENPELVERLRRRMAELDSEVTAGERPAWRKPRA